MDKSIAFEKQINPIYANFSVQSWHDSVALYDNKKYIESFVKIIQYINNKFPTPGDLTKLDLHLPHGSVIINFKADSETYTISALFLKLPSSASKIAVMRQVAELNFSYLILAQIYLKGDELFFEYQDKLENSDPYKIYSLLEEICFCADYYDDIFIEKFGAIRIQEPKVKYFSEVDKEKSYNVFIKTLQEAITLSDYFESKRYYNSACDLLATALLKIDYIIAPQGLLGSEISNAFNAMYKSDPIQTIISQTKDKMKSLLTYDKDKFYHAMYYPEYLIPTKRRAELPFIQDFVKTIYEEASSNIANKGGYLEAAISQLFIIYDLYYRYHIPQTINNMLEAALIKSGSQDWKTAAEALYKALDTIVNLDPQTDLENYKASDDSNSSSFVSSIKGWLKKLI